MVLRDYDAALALPTWLAGGAASATALSAIARAFLLRPDQRLARCLDLFPRGFLGEPSSLDGGADALDVLQHLLLFQERGGVARRLPSEKTARRGNKAKPLVCSANGFAVNTQAA